jgi:hypothetical protein
MLMPSTTITQISIDSAFKERLDYQHLVYKVVQRIILQQQH